MTSLFFIYTFRFAMLLLLQVLVLRNVYVEQFPYMHLFVYPIMILVLPMRFPTWLLLLVAFAMGVAVDTFYDSPGVHAAASVFSAFCRPLLIRLLQPRTGYTEALMPTAIENGIRWFFLYSMFFYFFHLLVYFSMAIFTPYYWPEILWSVVYSILPAVFIAIAYQYIFNPKR